VDEELTSTQSTVSSFKHNSPPRVVIPWMAAVIETPGPVIIMKIYPRIGRVHISRSHNDHFRFRADLLDGLAYEGPVLPDPLGDNPAIGFSCHGSGNRLNGGASIVIVHDRSVIAGRISCRLVILVNGVPNQSAYNRTRS
jgi:hypothetical protein